MRIVVLDGYCLNPGDLSWEELESLGDCTVHDRTSAEDTVSRSADAVIILTNKTVLDKDTIAQLPKLKYIGVLATGHNVVDTGAADEHGVIVTNVPEYATASVVQSVFAHVLHFYGRVAEHGVSVREGKWTSSKDFCFWEYPLQELAGKTMGIVGFGRIGSAVARVALALGTNVLAYNPSEPTDVPDGVAMTDLDSLFRESDIVSLHCPLTEASLGFVNAELLGKMKQTAFLVNTGRGPLVDESALAGALNEGRLAGAGIDVLVEEPPPPDCPLLSASNCFITPHIAWATHGARERLMQTAVGNVKAFLDGNSTNVVNGLAAS